MNTRLSSIIDAPLLVTLSRIMERDTPIIECAHRGLISVVDGMGEVVYGMGDESVLCHMRSCAKPFQVMPLLEMGLFDDLDKTPLSLADLALMMSSHAGSTIHTSRVAALLAGLGLSHSDLRCGIHAPQDESVRRDLLIKQTPPTELHNNCSGKHTAMLIACLHKGFSITSYEDRDHPLQQWIRATLMHLGDLKAHQIIASVDGCSMPSWAVPFKNIALLYARLAFWQTKAPAQSLSFAQAFKTIWEAATSHPEQIAGEHKFDTELIRAGRGQIISKTGADGLHALSILPSPLYPHGLGIAIKIADGDLRQTIRPLVVKSLFRELQIDVNASVFDRFMPPTKNFRGIVVSEVLDQLKKHR